MANANRVRPRRDGGPRLPRRVVEGDRRFAARLAAFKRLYRWLNLTLVQQGVWPLLLVLAAAPAVPVALTPLPWWGARTAGPILAALLAAVFLRRMRAAATGGVRSVWSMAGEPGATVLAGPVAGWFRTALPVLALMLAAARLLAGPADAAAKVVLFGVADVLAFQVIHFGVVRRSWDDEQVGTVAAVGLFAASWGLREVFVGAASGRLSDPVLRFVGAAAAGLAVALVSWAVRRLVGGFWPAAAVHLVVVYLVLGFA